MPFPVENIKAACKRQGTTLAEIERELGIGNGVIARWKHKKTAPPYDRLLEIAELLNTPIEELTGETKKEPAAKSDGLDSERAIWSAAWDNATPEQREAALAVLRLKVPPDED